MNGRLLCLTLSTLIIIIIIICYYYYYYLLLLLLLFVIIIIIIVINKNIFACFNHGSDELGNIANPLVDSPMCAHLTCCQLCITLHHTAFTPALLLLVMTIYYFYLLLNYTYY